MLTAHLLVLITATLSTGLQSAIQMLYWVSHFGRQGGSKD